MTELQITLWASFVGAGVTGLLSVAHLLLSSVVTQRRERKQDLWAREVDRIIDLEERAGHMVEVVGSNKGPEQMRNEAGEGLAALARDAGRFRRHKGIMNAIRGLTQHLHCLLDAKLRHEIAADISAEVDELYEKLLRECDSVTGKRCL